MVLNVVIPGYGHSARKSASLMVKSLRKKGLRVVVIDLFESERKSWLFRKFLLTNSDHLSAVKTAEEVFSSLNEEIGTVYTHSYGAVGLLAPAAINAERYVIISPPLESIEWKPLEKLFWFLAGFQELRNGSVQIELIQRLLSLKEFGKEITFITSDTSKDFCGDERVGYSSETIEMLSDLVDLKVLSGITHSQFMKDQGTVEKIVSET